ALLYIRDTRHHTIGVQVTHGCHWNAGCYHGTRQATAKAHTRKHVLMLRIEIADGLAQPAVGDNFIGLGSMSDVHASEVRTVGVGIANPLDDGHLPSVIELLQRP